jgi:hypothetical protein
MPWQQLSTMVPRSAQRLLFVLLPLLGCGDSTASVDAATLWLDGTASSCNPLHQTGCGGDNKCTVIEGALTCAPKGSIPIGGACESSNDDCIGGSLCVMSVCRAFCSRLDGPVDGLCMTGICPNGAPGEPPAEQYKTCSMSCVPGDVPCPGALSCYLPLDGEHETPGCLTPGTLELGAACQFPNECASGLTCASETRTTIGYASCQKLCIATQNDCSGTESCFERHAGDGYGICR